MKMRAWFEGSVDMEKVRHERPAWVERMEHEGVLQSALVESVPVALRVVFYAFGFTMITGCIYLLVNALANLKGLFG